MMALCEGPIIGVNQVYQGQSIYGTPYATRVERSPVAARGCPRSG